MEAKDRDPNRGHAKERPTKIAVSAPSIAIRDKVGAGCEGDANDMGLGWNYREMGNKDIYLGIIEEVTAGGMLRQLISHISG